MGSIPRRRCWTLPRGARLQLPLLCKTGDYMEGENITACLLFCMRGTDLFVTQQLPTCTCRLVQDIACRPWTCNICKA